MAGPPGFSGMKGDKGEPGSTGQKGDEGESGVGSYTHFQVHTHSKEHLHGPFFV